MLTKRIATWRAIFERPWVYVLSAIYGVIGLLDFFREKLLPIRYHDVWDRYYVMPDLSLQTWVMIGLGGSAAILLEGSYRLVKQLDEKHQSAIQSLRSELAEAQQKRDYRRIADELAQLHQQCLQLLMREVNCNDDYISWKEDIEDWYERSQAEIQPSLGFSEMELFRTSGGGRFVLSVQPFDGKHQQDLQFFHNRQYSLRMIIDDMNMRLR